MNLAILIPDGRAVRNFLFGPFFRQVQALERADVLHPFPDDVLAQLRPENGTGSVHWHHLRAFRGGPLRFLLRDTLLYAHMHWADTAAMRRRVEERHSQGPQQMRDVARWAMRQSTRVAGRMAAYPGSIARLDRWHRWAEQRGPDMPHYQELFKRIEPSVMFCTHQRSPDIGAPVLAAQSLGIPTATFVFGWDNLSNQTITVPFDHYLVWSESMRQELLRFYPRIRPDAIHIVGTPQFDPYAERDLLWSRQEFCQRIGADPARPLICYSGGDRNICPEDAGHIRLLMEHVRAGNIKGNPQVLLRPTPADDGARFQAVRNDYPELLYSVPTWLRPDDSNWENVIPLPEDARFLANVTFHSDVNINVASTMTLDFALRDTPVVNIGFDIASPPPLGVPILDLYYRQYEHYRPVVELGAARIARSPEELITHVNTYIEDPSQDRQRRAQLCNLLLGWPVGQASQRIHAVLEEIKR